MNESRADQSVSLDSLASQPTSRSRQCSPLLTFKQPARAAAPASSSKLKRNLSSRKVELTYHHDSESNHSEHDLCHLCNRTPNQWSHSSQAYLKGCTKGRSTNTSHCIKLKVQAADSRVAEQYIRQGLSPTVANTVVP